MKALITDHSRFSSSATFRFDCLGVRTIAILTFLVVAHSAVFAAQGGPTPASFLSASLLQFSNSGCEAESLAIGDFDEDGKPDLVVIGAACTLTADIFLGNGDGTFSLSQAISPLTGSQGAHAPHLVAVADFNGDGHLDFAVALQGSNFGSLDVYLGDGTGHFTFSANYSYGSRNGGIGSIAIADVNGDGKFDLIVGNGGYDGTITVLLGNGDGTFQSGTVYTCCQNNPEYDVMDVAIADFNNDGHPDIAVADQAGGIDILLNKGDGTFQAPVFYSEPGGGAFPNNESGIAAADLNQDGKQDVVLTWNGGFWVYLGNGDGTFNTPLNYSTPCGAYGCYGSSVALADINGDNKLDVIMSDAFGSTVWVFLGNGDGTFQPGTGYATDFYPQSVAIADFNGDGKPDFAVANDDDDQVTIVLGNGDGTFQAGRNYDLIDPYASSGEVAADFNNDGHLDVATWGSDGHNDFIRVMLNNSHGVLGTPIITTVFGCCTQSITDIAAGDVNGDGKVDLIGGINETNPQIAVFPGNGDGTFQGPVFYSTGSSQVPEIVALADLRNNGNLDILVWNSDGSLSVLLNAGNGTFGAATVTQSVSGSSAGQMATGDFNGDGKLDLALEDEGNSSINILLGNGDGTFQSPSKVPVASAPQGIAIGDFNGDGKLDLAAVGGSVGDNNSIAGGGLAILLGNGDGTFGAPTYYSFYPFVCCNGIEIPVPYLVAVADMNLDGIPDLLVAYENTHVGSQCCYDTNNIGIGVFLGNGDGTFEFENPLGQPGIAGGPFLVGTGSSSLVVGDFNGDGAPDAAVLNSSSAPNSYDSWVTMLLNTTLGHGANNGTTTTLTSSLNPAEYGQSVTFTATVATNEGGSPAGTVAFLDGGNQIGAGTLAGGQTALTISTLSVGSHIITAVYATNGTFQSSNSAPLNEVISPALTTTSVSPSVNPSMYGQTVTFTTTVTPLPDGGTITLTIDGTAVGTGSIIPVSGLSVGNHSVFASYSGDTDYAGSTSPTLTQVVNPSTTTYTLTVTTLGTGNGTVTDNLQQINCVDTAGVQSGACSASYNAGTTVTLTATPTQPATFGGWGGACTGTNGCSVLMIAPYTVTASFVPPQATASVPFSCPNGVYPCSNVTAPAAVFNCPSGTNPCTDPNAHSLALTATQVNSPFTLTVAATEVPTSQADGDCQANQSPSTDFDCRFTSFFPYETLADGDVIVPACDAYSNGNCVFYSVYYGSRGNEPPSGDYNGPISWSIAWNNTSFLPPATYPYQANNPRLYDDPDYEVSTTTPYGTNCSVPMKINGNPTNPPIYCQFVFDITSYYDPSQPPDAGIGGKTQQFNDVVVAFPLTVAAPQLSVSKTADQAQVNAGSPLGYTVSVSNSSAPGTGTASNAALNDPLPGRTAISWSISPAYTGPGTCTITGAAPAQILTCAFGSLSPAIGASLHVRSASSSGGTYVNTATLSADNNPTETSSATIQVNKTAPTVTFTGAPATATYNTTFTVTATTNASSMPSIMGSGPCTVGSVTGAPQNATARVTMSGGTGTCDLTASWAADSNYNSATLSQSTLALLAISTTSIVSSIPNPSNVAQNVVITFKVTGNGVPTGSVTVSATSGESCSAMLTAGAGNCLIVFNTPGSRSLTAIYGADSNFSGSSSPSLTQSVNASPGPIATLPGSVSFGTLYLDVPGLRLVTLSNTGTASLTIDRIRITAPGNDLDDFIGLGSCPKTLAAGKSCEIAVTCLANSANYSPTASLSITDNAPGSPQLVPLSATVINPQASLSSDELNFGNQTVGSTSLPRKVTLTNTGTTSLVLSSLTVSGNFAVATGTTCNNATTLKPAADCVMNVTFTPMAKGKRTGSLTIQDNARSKKQVVTLTGTGD